MARNRDQGSSAAACSVDPVDPVNPIDAVYGVGPVSAFPGLREQQPKIVAVGQGRMRRVCKGASDAVLPGGVQVVAGRVHREPIAVVRPDLNDRAFDHLGNVPVIVGVQMVELDDAPPAAQDDDLELRQDARVGVSVCGVDRCRPARRAGRAGRGSAVAS